MNASAPCASRPGFSRARFFVMAASTTFIVLVALLPVTLLTPARPHPVVQLRAGMIADFVNEMPIGREALFSSLALPPLPTLAALPCAFIFPAADCSVAYLYGIAMIMAAGAGAVAVFLQQRHLAGAWPAALLCTVGLALWPGSVNPDLAACLTLLATALVLESQRHAAHRALAGFLYAFAALCHPLGILALLLKFGWLIGRRLLAARDHERIAIAWIQGFSMIYVALVYVAFSWGVLGEPLHALRRLPAIRHHRLMAMADTDHEVAAMRHLLHGRYATAVPMVSGHWGYLVRDQLDEAAGHHFIAFHRDKIPAWEEHDLILLVPAPDNPFAALDDLAGSGSHDLPGGLLVESTDAWRIYRIAHQ